MDTGDAQHMIVAECVGVGPKVTTGWVGDAWSLRVHWEMQNYSQGEMAIL